MKDIEFNGVIYNRLKKINSKSSFLHFQFLGQSFIKGRLCKNKDPRYKDSFPWCVMVPGDTFGKDFSAYTGCFRQKTPPSWIKIMITDYGDAFVKKPYFNQFLGGTVKIKVADEYFAVFSDLTPYKKKKKIWKAKN